MPTRYISIDVATKSMAMSIVEHNGEPLNMRNKNSFKNLTIIKTITKNLAPNENNAYISDIDRVLKVNQFFQDYISEYITDDTIILLEKQISTTPSYICYIALLSLALNSKSQSVQTIAAARKNQLVIDDEKIGKYLRKYNNSYNANKQHSHGLVKVIRPYFTNTGAINIDKKMITDWSDTISQLIAYITRIQKTICESSI